MGYRGKVDERERARAMRAEGTTLLDIATVLGVSKSSVSVWVLDVPFTPSKRRQIEELDRAGFARIGTLSVEAFLAAGVALYAGEGSKSDGKVLFANTDPRMIVFFCAWLRRFFPIDESRLRAKVYLHEGLDIDATEEFWADRIAIPRSQFRAPYRAVADPSIRKNKHEHGCVYVYYYCCSETHRSIMGLVKALLAFDAIPG